MRVAYYPVIEDEDELVDLVSRAAWFLTFSGIERISVFVASRDLVETEWRVAPGMDSSIADRFGELRSIIELLPSPENDEIAAVIGRADVVLRWRAATPSGRPSKRAVEKLLAGKRVYRVDPGADRYEGSFYIEVGLALMEDRDAVIRRSRERFAQLAARVGRCRRGYVLATGPSVGGYTDLDLDDAVTIVCNSVILDQDLMSAVQPEIVVFADPIFHFGPSQYAASFRANLVEAAGLFDFKICIPLKYHDVFSAAVPELADRTIALPHRKDGPYNFDLAREFELKATANVLTYLMLPLASTFSDEIGILGCDGRPRSESGYFWSHNRNTQIHDKMKNIREVHPAFFAIDYDDYYDEHIDTLEEQLQDGEARGLRYRCLAFSHIPPLKRRMTAERSEPGNGVPPRMPTARVVIIDPDALDWNGHFMAYNDKFTEALGALGASVRVLCNRELAPEILAERPHFVPGLTRHSWSIGNVLAPTEAVLAAAEAELTEGVDLCVDDDGAAILYMYTGSVAHAEMVARMVRERPGLRGHINLFWSSFHAEQWEAWITRYREQLSAVNSTLGLEVTVPTEGVRRAIADSTGELFDLAPHPSTAVSDDAFQALRSETHRELGTNGTQRCRVLFPGAARGGKGFSSTLEAVRRLAESPRLEPVVRYAPHMTSVDPEERAAVDQLPEPVSVVSGDLGNDEFEELFRSCHMCVLPYDAAAFRNRTSGLLIDSVYYGRPVVVTAGTWLGDFVDRFGCGIVVEEPRPELLARAVEAIVEDYGAFARNARSAAESYFAGNSWRALATSVLAPASEPIVGPFPRSAQAGVDEAAVVARLMRGSHGRDSVMVDVGAHHGSSLSHFSDLGWRIIACEPDPVNREVLTKKHTSGRVTIDPRAVSDLPAAEAPFFESRESTGVSALHAFTTGHEPAGVVAVTTMNQLAQDYDLRRIDVLKIDVEGFDFNVLKGVSWEHITPEVIVCEFDDAKTTLVGYSYGEMADYLVERGYTIYMSEWHPIIAYGVRHQWRQLIRYPEALRSGTAWGNFIAFRSDPGPDAVAEALRACLEVTGRKEGRFADGGDRLEAQVTDLTTAHAVTSAELGRKLEQLRDQQAESQDALAAKLVEIERAVAARDAPER